MSREEAPGCGVPGCDDCPPDARATPQTLDGETLLAAELACEAELREEENDDPPSDFQRGFKEGCLSCRDRIAHLNDARALSPRTDGPPAEACPKEATNRPGCRPFLARQFCSDECWTAGHHVGNAPWRDYGDLSSVPPDRAVSMECAGCRVRWRGCADMYQCPCCGQGDPPWNPADAAPGATQGVMPAADDEAVVLLQRLLECHDNDWWQPKTVEVLGDVRAFLATRTTKERP